MKLIVGLGNPGRNYALTRHNIGFGVLDYFAEKEGVVFKSSPVCEGQEAKIFINEEPVLLLKPTTFMNLSGIAVKASVVKREISIDDLLVVLDDMDLPFGSLRIKPNGSDGGHNGLTSIIDHLGTKQFARIRMGISRPAPGVDTATYVLANFTSAEEKVLPDFIKRGHACIVSWANNGVDQTMNEYNKKEGAHD